MDTARRLPRPLILCLACLLTWGAGTGMANEYDLPSMGAPSSTVLSPAKAQRLGGRVMSHLMRSGQIMTDVELRNYLQQIGRRLIRPTQYSPEDFRFFMVDQPVINAFALPGGYIGIYAGLFLETATESELAAVMAHETAHITQRHIARQMQAMQGMKWASLAALLAAAIAGGGDAMQAAIAGSITVMHRRRISYTRAHELEADRIGIRRLAAAHFDPEAMASFFETMQQHARLYGSKVPPLLRTHPVTNVRIAEARARAQDYASPKVITTGDYAVMKERARVLSSTNRSRLLDYYRTLGAPGDTSPAKDYGYALTLARTGRVEHAITILRHLTREYPRQVHYVTALARALAMAGRADKALALMQDAIERFDNAPALLLEYAQTLLDSGQPARAAAFLHRHAQLTHGNYHAQKILSRAAGRQGKLGEAYYRRALYYRLRGAYVPAVRQLRTALHRHDLDTIDRQRLDALLTRMIEQCKNALPEGECRRRVLGQHR